MAKKIKAPIPLFKNLHDRQARWASYERLSSLGGVRELVAVLLCSQLAKPFIFIFGARNRSALR